MTKLPHSLIPVHRFPRVFAVLLLLATGLAATSRAATSVSQHGITWTFDRDYPTGRFANGDHWVVGPVRIVSITPRSVVDGGKVMHGSMVNPKPNSSQGYDSRIKNNRYNAERNVARKLPLVLPPSSSLLSSESYREHATRDNPQLKTIAVLTVLGAPAPAGSFRPPYVGTDKALRWNESQLRYERLRSLPPVPHAPKPSEIAGQFDRPWIEQGTTWVSRYLHPGENQPGYGREIAHTLARGLLTLQLDYSRAEKRDLLVRLVQYGIDIYGSAREGAIWPAGGGHNHGRKMPLLLAAAVLGDDDMLSYVDGRKLVFQEDRQTFYVTAADVGRALYTRDGRPREQYKTSDVGIAEWGEKHAQDPAWDGRNWNAYYRTVAGASTIGHVLTARIMGLQQEWNWPATFDYYDRYWSIENRHAGNGANSIQKFVAEMWKAYRHAEKAEFTERTVATQIWENTALANQTSTFTIAFDLLPSGNRINSITGLSNGAADAFTDLAASVRFSPTGVIDARDAGTFRATRRFAYEAGVRYRVTMTVNPREGRYSVSVAAPGGSPVVIADGFRFRAEQRAVKQLNNLGFKSSSGYHAVMNLSLQPGGLSVQLAMVGLN